MPLAAPAATRILCNRERADAVMAKYGLDALVVTDPRNVYYLSNFDANLMWNWSNVAFAILPRDPARPATLVIAGLDAPTLLENPTWMPEVRAYTLKSAGGQVQPTDIRPEINPDGELGPWEQRAIALFESLTTFSAGDPWTVLGATLADLGLERARMACDDLRLAGWLRDRAVPLADFVDGRDIMREIRLVKTPDEVTLLREAAVRNERAQRVAIDFTRPGRTWDEIVQEYRIAMIREGGAPTYLIRGAGELAAVRVQVGDYPVKEGDLVFYDALGTYKHYHGDVGRTAYVGEAPAEVRRSYQAMRDGWAAACEQVRPGITAHQLGEIVRDTVHKAGFPAYAVCTPHSLGLEHFDHPQAEGFYQDFVIERGTVLNIDMPFFEYAWGAMHLEDTIVVRPDGVEFLTSNRTALIELPLA